MSIETTAPAAAEVTAEPVVETPPAGEVETPVPGEEALGDPGKKALDAMKAEKRAALQEARDAKAQLAEALARIDGKEKEFAAEQERRKVEADALAKANERILKAEVRAAAAGVLEDPTDALLFLDLSQFEVGDDGDVDTAAVKAAIVDLAKSKPRLAAQGGKPEVVFESPGDHRKGAPAAQLTQADLGRMSAEQIVQAESEGRLDVLKGLKP
jgi:hypothetical protein